MSAFGEKLAGSVSVKAAIVGVLVLVMLIPVAMVEGVVWDRQNVHNYARQDITASWGGPQRVIGPVLVIPYSTRHEDADGQWSVRRSRLFVLPSELRYEADVDPDVLHRGLHKVAIYRAIVDVSGVFPAADLSRIEHDNPELHYDEAFVVADVSDTRGIAETPAIQIHDSSSVFEPGGSALITGGANTAFGSGLRIIRAPVGDALGEVETSFTMRLSLKGSDELTFVPFADTTQVVMRSDWADPGFFGQYLPDSRDISDSGFDAAWQVSGLGRGAPSQWTGRSNVSPDAQASAFGVRLYIPVSMYQVTLRAANYAVLIIGLTFVAWFLTEMLTELRLHPLQYVLVGFANALFYLLLISFAEHVGFGLAYLISSAASTSLIAGYSSAVLGARKFGLLMAAVLTGIYGLLYITLNAETFALLGGAIGLWVTLALIMYLTRRIDWYKQGAALTQPRAE